ncbi:hypothetical protein WJX82_004565 [Trebouxia sp. C0006]
MEDMTGNGSVLGVWSAGTVTGSLGSFGSISGTTLGVIGNGQVSGNGSVLGVFSTGTVTGSLESLATISGTNLGVTAAESAHEQVYVQVRNIVVAKWREDVSRYLTEKERVAAVGYAHRPYTIAA